MQYENAASYMSLAISDWFKQREVSVGEFNRILFQEANSNEDFSIVASAKTMIVELVKDFKNLDQFNNAEATHHYFLQKCLQGFTRVDTQFSLNLTAELEVFLANYFKNGYVYEKEMKSKRINGIKYQVL